MPGTCMGKPAKEKIAYFAAHVGANIAMALPIQVCGSPNTREPNSCPNTTPTQNFLSRMTLSSNISRCKSTFASNFALQFSIHRIWNVRFTGILVHFFESDL